MSLARNAEELPYQLRAAGEFTALSRLLTNLRWFNALFARGQLELQSYWRAVRSSGIHLDVEAALYDAVDAQLPPYAKWTKRQWQLVCNMILFVRDGGWASERSLHMMEKCVELETAIGGNANVMAFDAQCRLAAMASSLGHYDKAQSLLEEAVAGHEALLGDDHPHTLDSKHRLAVALSQNSQPADAKALLEGVIPKLMEVFGAEAPQTLAANKTLSNVLQALGELDRAQALRESILQQFSRTLGPDDPDTLEVMSASAIALRAAGNPAGACALHAKVLAKRRELLGDDHPHTVATLVAYGLALIDAGNLAQAEHYLREAMAIARTRSDCHHQAHQAGRALADALLLAERYDEAFALEAEMVTALEQRGDTESPEAIETIEAYAIALSGFGRFAEAKTRLEQVLAAESRIFGATSRKVFTTKGCLAQVLVRAGERDAARQLFQDTIAAGAAACGALDEGVLRLRQELLQLLNVMGHADAIALGEDLLDKLIEATGEDDPRIVDCLVALADACLREGQFDRSVKQYHVAFTVLIKQHRDVPLDVFYRYAQACFGAGRDDAGRDAENLVVTQLMSRPEQPHESKLSALMQLGGIATLRFRRSDFDGADDILRHILAAETRIFGSGSAEVRHTQNNMAAVARGRQQALSGASGLGKETA
jgi:tetratricopeptide (TPR) repeat protein